MEYSGGIPNPTIRNYDIVCAVLCSLECETVSVHRMSPVTLGAFPTHHGDETGTRHCDSFIKEGGHARIGLCMLT